jgi:putative ABC transport system permease protein
MGFDCMGDLLREANQVIRGLFRSPGFTLLAVLTMAVGIGANTAMFSVIENVILRPLPYRDPAGIVMLWSGVPKKDIQKNWTSYPDIQDWRRESHSFKQIAAILRVDTANLSDSKQVERVKVGRVSSGFFPVLGVAPQLGRSWTALEEERRAPVAVVSYGFWQTHFGGASDVIGKPLEIDHKRAVVVGVMPPDFSFPTADTRVWIPLTFIPQWPAFLTARQADAFNAVARLQAGVTPQQAQQEMDSISAHLNKQYPQFEAGKSVNVVPLSEELIGPRIRASLWMLFGAVVFVLFIACTNVASLMLARQSSREKENAVRVALGASRVRLIRLQLVESVVLSLLAALPGVGIAAAAIPVVRAFGPRDIRGFADLRLNPEVLAFCALLSVITGVLFGLGPAWLKARRDPQGALKAGGRTMTGSLARRRLGGVLMALQLALAMVLVTGAGLMLRSFLHVQDVDLGYQPQGLLFLHLDAPRGEGGEPAALYDEALARIRAIPGVQGAGAIDALFSDYVPDLMIDVEGHAHLSAGDDSAASGSHVVSRGYFETAAVPLLRGRFFASTDGPHSQPVAMINESMAKRLWPGENPIDRRFRYGVPGETPSVWRTVVGVVGDTLPDGKESRVYPQFFLPQTQVPWTASMDLVIRAARLPLANSIRAAILSVSAEIPRFEVTTVDAELEALGNPRRFQTWLLSSFSVIALILAAIGIYGLISYSVSERTAEIGIRMALGARPVDIMSMILGQVSMLAAAGLLLGLAGALALSHAAANLLFGVAWTDGRTLALATLLLFMVALTAGYIPARRATRVDPAIALSSE